MTQSSDVKTCSQRTGKVVLKPVAPLFNGLDEHSGEGRDGQRRGGPLRAGELR